MFEQNKIIMGIEKYTPIKDSKTGDPIRLGDLVENEKGQCGTLIWDDYFNKYLIRTETGGNAHSQSYKKVKELKPNNIDSTRVECRKFPNKKRW